MKIPVFQQYLYHTPYYIYLHIPVSRDPVPALRKLVPDAKSGYYWIDTVKGKKMEVFCDMTNHGTYGYTYCVCGRSFGRP